MTTKLALLTDLYELTMAQAYLAEGMDEEATFSLFARRLPPERQFLVACGLESVLAALATARFDRSSLDYLASLETFDARFLAWLSDWHFRGEVRSVAEGTPIFAGEPILEISGRLAEVQLVETLVMNQIHIETLVASKAARFVLAAQGKKLIDFGARRAHGSDAALKAARASYLAGFDGTSNLLAAKAYGIPASGTMAHSYVQAHASEPEAFRAFARQYPETVLLVDTYDTLTGVDHVIALAHELGEAFRVRAIRLDSGDLGELARASRRKLDAAGLRGVGIFASSSLDEHRIAALVGAGAPIDGFGVGTNLTVASDAPTLDLAYKLVSYAGEGRLKLSRGKETLPGRKQVWRRYEAGVAAYDLVGLDSEVHPGEPLLAVVMRHGERIAPPPSLEELRRETRTAISRLPATLRSLRRADSRLDVRTSSALEAERDRLAALVA